MRPYSPIPRFVRGNDHAGLIHRFFCTETDADVQRIDLITTTTLRLSVIDSGHHATEHIAEGDTCVHVLWQADERDAHILIGGDRFEISPADSTWIPAGDAWQLSPDQLVICIVGKSRSLAVPIEPTHGEDRFVGHNRETLAPASSGLSMSRWKLTGPLQLEESDQEIILVGLYADVAIQFDGGVSMLPQGEASVIRPGMGRITLVPNGLSYLLAINV